MMTYEEAKRTCHVRSAIFRMSKDQRFWRNHTLPFDKRVSDEDKQATDWEEYDTRDSDECSLFMFND